MTLPPTHPATVYWFKVHITKSQPRADLSKLSSGCSYGLLQEQCQSWDSAIPVLSAKGPEEGNP